MRRIAVLVAIALSDVPIHVLAERLNTTAARYKTLYDAWYKHGAALAAREIDIFDRDDRGKKP